MKRVIELDGLRGLAVLAVLAFHTKQEVFYVGWAGVDLFFVLSGYLITSIVLAFSSQRHFFAHFFARRALRLWPLYYLLLAAVIVVGVSPAGWLPQFLTYTQYMPKLWSDAPLHYPWYLVHTWTLAIEEQFYLVWPLLICLVGRRHLWKVTILLIVMSAAARGLGVYPRLLLARCDGFALGALLATLPCDLRTVRVPIVIAGVTASLFLFAGGIAFGFRAFLGEDPIWPGSTIFAFGVMSAAAMGVCVLYEGYVWLVPLRARWLVYIGKISYGIYLFHFPLFAGMSTIANYFELENGLLLKVVRMAVVFAVPAMTWTLIERPLLSLKRLVDYQANPETKGHPCSADATAMSADLGQRLARAPQDPLDPANLDADKLMDMRPRKSSLAALSSSE